MEEKRPEELRVLSASGIPKLDDDISELEGIRLVGRCNLKSELLDLAESVSADILLVSDHLSGEGNMAKLILKARGTNLKLRIIYFAGELSPRDTKRRDMLGMLVMVGINDIVLGRNINRDIVADAILHPRAPEAVSFLANNLIDQKAEVMNAIGGLVYEEAAAAERDDTENNVFVFTSIKPGTGKSFAAINTACAIAKYGKDRPKVALIDADLQTLSVGTALGMPDDPNRNIKTCMEALASVFEKGKLIDEPEKVKSARRKAKECFVKYPKIPNLSVLIGSSLTPQEVDELKIRPEYYNYLVDIIREEYDIVIVDLNSNIFHVTSFGILRMCRTAYYIINLDFNNIRNNVRYRNMLDDIDISYKIKYILNQAIDNKEEFDYLGVSERPLVFTPSDMEKKSNISIFKKIPYISPVVAYNDAYNGVPVILDMNEGMEMVRFAILEIANDIYPMGSEYEKLKALFSEEEKRPGLIERLFKRKSEEKTGEDMAEAEDGESGSRGRASFGELLRGLIKPKKREYSEEELRLLLGDDDDEDDHYEKDNEDGEYR